MRGLICWDLDETIGYFRPLGDEIVAELRASQEGLLRRLWSRLVGPSEVVPDPDAPPIRLRAGIDAALTRLGEAGFVQVVTTGSFEIYANRALERYGLRRHFADVFGRERVWEGRGKVYRDVLAQFEATPEQTLILGDSFERDRSIDEPGIVMICQPDGLDQPASALPPLIEALSEPDGFRAGFDRWLTETPVSQRWPVVLMMSEAFDVTGA
ncbi:MAG: HAD family hydrolase [Planctomycetes bacterium]|nr:HAD family hydrolase [Planctomycetota bacterium]